MRVYLDTSIWLDLFENRNERCNPKSDHAFEMMKLLVLHESMIIVSNLIFDELSGLGYFRDDIQQSIEQFSPLVEFVIYEPKLDGYAGEVAKRRNLPKADVLHALIARSNKAILISRDRHFLLLTDFVKLKKPEELFFE